MCELNSITQRFSRNICILITFYMLIKGVRPIVGSGHVEFEKVYYVSVYTLT